MIQIAFQLTRQELFKGLLAISISRPGTKAFRLIGILFILVSFLSVLIDIFSTHYPAWYVWYFIVFSLYFTFSPEITIRLQTNNIVKRNAQITEALLYTFNESDYNLTGESFSARMDYAKLYEVREMPDFILLKTSACTAHIIPKHALSVDQFALFKELIQSVPTLKSSFDS